MPSKEQGTSMLKRDVWTVFIRSPMHVNNITGLYLVWEWSMLGKHFRRNDPRAEI